jgi:hypothetical protein
MSKRLQVVLGDEEMTAFEESARSEGLTLSEWVRRSLHDAERRRSRGNADEKIAAIRQATQHRFPATDIETMIDEIEQGYSGSTRA